METLIGYMPLKQILKDPKFWVIWGVALAIVLAVTIPRIQDDDTIPDENVCLLKKQILGVDAFNKRVYNFDGWGFTHFILFFILGYLYPGHFWFFFLIGLGWEIFEEIGAPKQGKLISNCKPCATNFYCDNIFQKLNLHAEWEDVFTNSFGYIVGQYIRQIYQFN